VINANGCYSVAVVTLVVLPPVKSDVLKDKIICMEDKTTLDAGLALKAMNGAPEQLLRSSKM
jgi:hypothetical protein